MAFDNVPEKLMIYVRDHISQYIRGTDRNLMYLAAGGGVIHQFIGRNYFEPDSDKFLNHRIVGENDTVWFGYATRILLIGESLFLMRSCSGFPEICRRLKDRDLKASTFEMLAAKAFFRSGFDIGAQPETGKKGDDFDFTAKRGDEVINVEVTALDEKVFSIGNVVDTLGRKRKQVPKTAPAVLFCVMPENWDSTENLNRDVPVIADKFLRGTKRINAVVFEIERHKKINPEGGSGIFAIIKKVYYKDAPYHACDLTFLDGDVIPTSTRQRMELVRNSEDANSVLPLTQTSEFYRWVDSLVP